MKAFLTRLSLCTLTLLLHTGCDVEALVKLPFLCPTDGNPLELSYHPHIYSCNKFITCLFGHTYVFECASGLVWNQRIRICDYPANVDCNIHDSYCPKGPFYGDDNDCNKFYMCNGDGSIQVFKCPHYLHWNQVTKQCDWPINANCERPQIVNGALIPLCPMHENPWNPTQLPYPGDCTKFLKCSHGRVWIFKCPSGLLWSVTHKRCEYPYAANCNTGNESTSTSEASTDTTTPGDQVSTDISESTRGDGDSSTTETTTPGDQVSTDIPESTLSDGENSSASEASTDTTTPGDQVSTDISESTLSDGENSSASEASTDTTTPGDQVSTDISESTRGDRDSSTTETTTPGDQVSTDISESIRGDGEYSSTASIETTTRGETDPTQDTTTTKVEEDNSMQSLASTDSTGNGVVTNESLTSTTGSDISTTTMDPRLPYMAPQCNVLGDYIKFPAEDCTRYYLCLSGYAYLLNCYDGYVFSAANGDCVRSEICI